MDPLRSLLYAQAPSILALADSSGSNSYHHYIFKQKLQELVDDLGIEIRMAHYPPYCSKWNPVEHRVFPHMTRAMQGVIFTNYTLVKELIETTSTKTGLQVVAHLVSKVYATGKKVADDFKDTLRILFDENLGQWNYRAVPAPPFLSSALVAAPAARCAASAAGKADATPLWAAHPGHGSWSHGSSLVSGGVVSVLRGSVT